MTTTTAFSERLRKLRRDRNLSQRELADWMGIDHSYISKLENNAADHSPSEHLLEQLAEYFEVDAEELIFAAGRIPSTYSGLLAELAVKYGRSLPALLKQLLENHSG